MRAMLIGGLALAGVLGALGIWWGLFVPIGVFLGLAVLVRAKRLSEGLRPALVVVAVVSAFAAFASLRPATLGLAELAWGVGAFVVTAIVARVVMAVTEYVVQQPTLAAANVTVGDHHRDPRDLRAGTLRAASGRVVTFTAPPPSSSADFGCYEAGCAPSHRPAQVIAHYTAMPTRFVVDAPHIDRLFWDYRDVLVVDASAGTLPYAFAWIGSWVATPWSMIVVAFAALVCALVRWKVESKRHRQLVEGEALTYRTRQRAIVTTIEHPRGVATIAWLGVLPIVVFRIAAIVCCAGY